MSIPRRTFLRTTMAAVAATSLNPAALQAAGGLTLPDDRFDPWIEVERSALAANVAEVRRLTGGRPILAVVSDMIDGVVLASGARGPAAADIYDELWSATQNWLGSPSTSDRAPHLTVAA